MADHQGALFGIRARRWQPPLGVAQSRARRVAETWQQKLAREARQMDAALEALFSRPPPDEALRARLEALAQEPRFRDFTWSWGPRLAQRSRVLFRPFILSNFSAGALSPKGEWFDPWKKDPAPLEAWLTACDAADDVELTRRLWTWRLASQPWKQQAALWRAEVLRRFAGAASPAARHTALAKVDSGWMRLDAPTALALYARDAAAARPFINSHLPYFGWMGEKRKDWLPLLERTRGDEDFHFELYRRLIDEPQWQADVRALARSVTDPRALDAELERRHPAGALTAIAEVFLELLRARRADALPYVQRHLASVAPRWTMLGRREAKALPELLALSNQEGWLELWAGLVRTCGTPALFDGEVRRLVRAATTSDPAPKRRLLLIAGHGREANFPGISFAQVQPLEEATALELYARFPGLVGGPFRLHVAPGWHQAYPELIRAALEARDDELVDFFAARAGIEQLHGQAAAGWQEALSLLCAHFEQLPEAEFVRRAASALSRMPAYAVWSYDRLLESNPLARLLFERSTGLYLQDGGALRDLLESPQIHVQVLAFRVLARREPRAVALAAANLDLLQATLLRPLHRRTRLLAFEALANAAEHDADSARRLLARLRDALGLPEQHYPHEELVGLVARVLHRWPALRGPAEAPRVYGAPAAGPEARA